MLLLTVVEKHLTFSTSMFLGGNAKENEEKTRGICCKIFENLPPKAAILETVSVIGPGDEDKMVEGF